MRRRRTARSSGHHSHPPIRRFARAVVFFRFAIVAAWIAAVVGASVYLPSLEAEREHGLRALVPPRSEALRAEIESVDRFGDTLLARTLVVQRDPDGLAPDAQARAVLRAVSLTRGEYPHLRGIVAAVPVTNALELLPSASEEGTTALTYLFFDPRVSIGEQELLAQRFVREELDPQLDAPIGVTGSLPGRLAQAREILRHLNAVELLTVIVIALLVGAHFRAFGAPLVTLAAAAISYLLSIRLLAWALTRLGGGIPEELEPLMVVLLLGIVTDYSIFFLERARRRLLNGASGPEAARHATSETWSIVATAGVAVAAGALALLAAEAGTYRALGPGLALSVGVGLAVSVTLVPALIGVFGSSLFWPSLRASDGHRRWVPLGSVRERVTHAATNRWLAAPIAVAGVAVLAVLAWSARSTELGFSLVGALPNDSGVKRAALAAGRGFAPGVVSPAMITVESEKGLNLDPEVLTRLQELVEQEPGIAGVVGPREVTALSALLETAAAGIEVSGPAHELRDDPAGEVMTTFVTPDGTAARMLVILEREPLGAPAIDAVERLDERLPSILSEAGLVGANAALAGDTAISRDTIDQTLRDLRRVGLVVVVLMLLLLIVFLRAAIAPFYLVAVSLLAFFASLGITAYVFREAFGIVTMSFFVPFASAVLLISLGSDYNIFLVGRIWEEARRRPLREAIAVAAPDASRAISVAGITLAASFSVLAIIPVTPMRQFAAVMGIGILLDTFFVRAVVVPALIATVGSASAWPGRFRRPDGGEPTVEPRAPHPRRRPPIDGSENRLKSGAASNPGSTPGRQ
jgi:RND superfamily putative drug exporter